MAHWLLTAFTHDGGRVYRHRYTGELAHEPLQEARLVALPAQVEAEIRCQLVFQALKATITEERR